MALSVTCHAGKLTILCYDQGSGFGVRGSFVRKRIKALACNCNGKTLCRRDVLLRTKMNKLSTSRLHAQISLEKSIWLTDDFKKNEEDMMSELVDRLHNLCGEVNQMIVNGVEESAWDLINANYEAVMDQLEMGMKGVEQAAILDILAQLHLSLNDVEGAKVLLKKLGEVIASIRNHEPLLDKILEDMGNMYTAIEMPEDALPLYRRSLDIQKNMLGNETSAIVNLLISTAHAYIAANEESKSKDLYREAISVLERTKGIDCEELVYPLTDLSHLLIKEWKARDAEDLLHRCVTIMKKSYGESHDKVGDTMCVLARALCAQGKVSDAVILYKKALDIIEKNGNMPLNDPYLEKIRTDLAELLHVLGRDEESQQLWGKNLFVQEQAVGKDHPSLAIHLHNLAKSYAYSEKFDECEHLLKRCIKTLSDGLGPDAPETTGPMLDLASTLYYTGRHEEAETLAENVLRIRDASLETGSFLIGEACDFLSSMKHSLKKYGEAEPLTWRVLQIQEKEFGYDSKKIISTLEKLISCLGNLGKEKEKLPLFRRLGKLKAKYEILT